MGFADDLEYIVEQMNPNHQTLMFSATMPKHVRKLADRILEDPEQIQASGKEERPPSLVKQYVMICTLRQRRCNRETPSRLATECRHHLL